MKSVSIKYVVVSIFTVACLICVGFAAWTHVQMYDEDGITGEIVANPVVKTDEYLFFNTALGKNGSGIQSFDYYEEDGELGFVNYNSSLQPSFSQTEAHLVLFFSLDKSKDYTVFKSSALSVVIDLTIEGYDGSYTDLISNASGSVTVDGAAITAPTSTIGSSAITLLFAITAPEASATGEQAINVTVRLTPKNAQSFINVIKNGAKINFNTSLKDAE